MKKFTYLAFVALSLFTVTSCTKTVVDMNAPDNSGSGSSAGNGNNNSNGSNSSAKFDWTGTPPISVKLDGVPYVCDEANIVVTEENGFYSITFKGNDEANIVGPVIQFKSNTTPGTVFDIPNPNAQMKYTDVGQGFYWLCFTSGHLKIVTNDATTLEGYFYGDLIDPADMNVNLVRGRWTEGYFKVTKP